MPDAVALPPAVAAFDAVAERFDDRFGNWLSVAAQRRAVRNYLLSCFPANAHLLELAGGTAEDALFLAAHGYRITLTDGSPAMVQRARTKVHEANVTGAIDVREVVLEHIDTTLVGGPFDGVYSNFAGLNCVRDPQTVARSVSRLVRPGAAVVFVVFGPFAPGELFVQLARGNARAAFRRLQRDQADAWIGGHHFDVHYHAPSQLARAFAPWFTLRGMRGIGVFVPPSAAEPMISRWPRLLAALEKADRVASRPLASLGDHVLLHFERTGAI
jgi:ubiquinone/menaquinone biosynthesis C-methylase UbiE